MERAGAAGARPSPRPVGSQPYHGPMQRPRVRATAPPNELPRRLGTSAAAGVSGSPAPIPRAGACAAGRTALQWGGTSERRDREGNEGMGEGLTGVHNIVGTLVVVAYLALTVVNLLRLRGANFSWARPLSFAAAGLLLVQYLIGFALLGQGQGNAFVHYVVALLAILTVGLEHGYANTRPDQRGRASAALAATGLTFLLVAVAYSIGSAR